MDIPSVEELFLQLTLPGPPATQYFPNCVLCFAMPIASCSFVAAIVQDDSNQ